MDLEEQIEQMVREYAATIASSAARALRSGKLYKDICIEGNMRKQAVQDLISEQGLSTVELSKSTGIGRQQLWATIYYGGRVSYATVAAIAAALGVEIDDIYCIEITFR